MPSSMKLFKGLFFAVLALIIYAHSDNDVPRNFATCSPG